MNNTTKTLLLVGGLAAVVVLVMRHQKSSAPAPAPVQAAAAPRPSGGITNIFGGHETVAGDLLGAGIANIGSITSAFGNIFGN